MTVQIAGQKTFKVINLTKNIHILKTEAVAARERLKFLKLKKKTLKSSLLLTLPTLSIIYHKKRGIPGMLGILKSLGIYKVIEEADKFSTTS